MNTMIGIRDVFDSSSKGGLVAVVKICAGFWSWCVCFKCEWRADKDKGWNERLVSMNEE